MLKKAAWKEKSSDPLRTMKKKFHICIKKSYVQKWDQDPELEVAQQWGTGVIQKCSSCPAAFLLR